MTHIWLRAEQRDNEDRVGLTPNGARALIGAGFDLTVERSNNRIIPDAEYTGTGAFMAEAGSWPDAPRDAIIFGLKELPDDGTALPHRHIMFGHAYKGQHSGKVLLERFKRGGGALYDLEYLTDETGRRLAAFGYWAGFAGAAVTLKAWAAQQRGAACGSVSSYPNQEAMLAELRDELSALTSPNAIVIGALGRVGAGATDLCEALGVSVTKWDMAETANGGPFPEILAHDLFFNCILARQDTPAFVPVSALTAPRRLSAIGDIACDPDSDYNPVPLYAEATSWAAPVIRVQGAPVLDIMAIDNLPSLLPLEASIDFAEQLLPVLKELGTLNQGTWQRAFDLFQKNCEAI